MHVDDDSSLLEVTRLMLRSFNSNFEVLNANGVDTALKILQEQPVDVIISDYEMPQKNGLDFLKELKRRNILIPFILFTGRGREEIAIQALNLGADGYFNKQGDPETVYGELAHGVNVVFEGRKAKLALDESENRCRTIMNQAREMIFMHDVDGRFVYVNPQASRSLGYSEEEFYLMNVVDVDRNATRDSLGALWPKVLAGDNFTFETVHKRKDGSVYQVEVSISPIKVDGQQLVMGIARDVTERKRNEASLRESAGNLKSIIENSDDRIFLIDSDYRYITVNKSLAQSLGLSPEELIGKLCYEDFDSETGGKFLDNLKKVFETGEKLVVEEKVKILGEERVLSTELSPVLNNEGKTSAVSGIIRDITGMKRAWLELESKYEIVERIAESIDSGLAIISRDYRVVWCNSILSKVGFKPNQKCYKTIDKNKVAACSDCGVRRIFEDNAAFDVHEYKTVISGETMFFELRATPLKDKQGQVIGAIELVVPITERKKAEQEMKNSNIKLEILNQKLHVVGSLTRHDVRNKLAAIKMNVYLIKKKFGANEELMTYLDSIEQGVSAADRLFDLSSLFERIGSEEHIEMDVKKSFDEAVALIPNLDKVTIKINLVG